MNKKTKNVTAFVVASSIGGLIVGWRRLGTQVANRFPEIDPKICRKAYRNMMLKALTNRLPEDLDKLNDEQIDVIFLREVALIK